MRSRWKSAASPAAPGLLGRLDRRPVPPLHQSGDDGERRQVSGRGALCRALLGQRRRARWSVARSERSRAPGAGWPGRRPARAAGPPRSSSTGEVPAGPSAHGPCHSGAASSRSSWTSRSRTAPSTSASQASSGSSGRELGREDVGEDAEGGAQPTGRDPHVVELLGVLAQPGAGLVGEQRAELATDHRVGEGADRRVGPHRGGPEVDARRDHVPAGQHAGLELGQRRRRESRRPAGGPRRRGVSASTQAAATSTSTRQEAHRVLVVDRDGRLVQGDLGNVLVGQTQHERAPPGLDLEHRMEWAAARSGPRPASRPDRPALATGPCPARDGSVTSRRRFGPVVRRSPRQRLQGDLLLVLGVPHAKDVAGLGDPPVLGVEVAVVLDDGRAGEGGDRAERVERDCATGE